MSMNIALLGFGNVGRALAEMLIAKRETLVNRYGIEFQVVGISTGRHGHAMAREGLDLAAALDCVRAGRNLSELTQGPPATSAEDFVLRCPADLVLESIPTNPHDGEPALNYTRTLLDRGRHVVSANKGPAVFAQRELAETARREGVGYFFESSVLGGVPIFALLREGMPAAELLRLEGILNSTTNYILDRMATEGVSFDNALRAAQEIGVAETDPTLDVDGWDASIKIAILANVSMGASLRPADVQRTGIRGITAENIQAAAAEGEVYRLICRAQRDADGLVRASVQPERVPAASRYGLVRGTGSILHIESDTLGNIALVDQGAGVEATAYGMLADMINLARGRAG